MSMFRAPCTLIVSATLLTATLAFGDNWPQFRGPSGNATSVVNASPDVSNNQRLLRTDSYLYCIGQQAAE